MSRRLGIDTVAMKVSWPLVVYIAVRCDQGEANVKLMAEEAGVSQPTIRRHIAAMRDQMGIEIGWNDREHEMEVRSWGVLNLKSLRRMLPIVAAYLSRDR